MPPVDSLAGYCQIEPERVALVGRHAGADRLDRRDHAAVAAEDAVGERRRCEFGVAVGEAARIAARSSSRRGSGLSAQAVMNAPAVERLMPA